MARPSKPRRQFQPAKKRSSLDDIIRELRADEFFLLEDHPEDSPLLAGLPLEKRIARVEDEQRRRWQEREHLREPVLLERLNTWGPEQWGPVFTERPDLETRLTGEQRARWQAWLAGRSGGLT